MWYRSDTSWVFDDENVRKSLGRYLAVMKNEKTSKFMMARQLPAEFKSSDSMIELWKEHVTYTDEFYKTEHEADLGKTFFEEKLTPRKSYFDLKIEIASRILEKCHLCKRRCLVNRKKGEVGYCKCGNEIAVSSIFHHLGEEPELVPSGTIFTMGCTMRCLHCQNWRIANWIEKGALCTPKELSEEVKRLRLSGCRNANLVGGDPTPWLLQWLQTFKQVSVNIPVVWNSNAYYSHETAHLLAGFADVYLLDFKYGPGECAERISEAPNYWRMCTSNHLEASKNGELIIRVLVLPNHLECCTGPILNWIARNLGAEIRVNLMYQYRPEWHARKLPELGRRLTLEEKRTAQGLAEKAGLKNCIA